MGIRLHEHSGWKMTLVIFGTIGLASGFVRIHGFWNNYVLDIVGPAWNYILIRGLFSKTQPAMLSRILSPGAAFLVIIGACFVIEMSQYLKLYDAYFDPFDFVAYVSLILPCYVLDKWLLNRSSSRTDYNRA